MTFNEVPVSPFMATDSSGVQQGIYLPKQVGQNPSNDVNPEEEEDEFFEIVSEDSRESNKTPDESPTEQSDGELNQTVIPGRQLRSRDSIRPPKRYETNLVQYNVPSTFQEAVKGPEAKEWTQAIQEELDAHSKCNT